MCRSHPQRPARVQGVLERLTRPTGLAEFRALEATSCRGELASEDTGTMSVAARSTSRGGSGRHNMRRAFGESRTHEPIAGKSKELLGLRSVRESIEVARISGRQQGAPNAGTAPQAGS